MVNHEKTKLKFVACFYYIQENFFIKNFEKDQRKHIKDKAGKIYTECLKNVVKA